MWHPFLLTRAALIHEWANDGISAEDIVERLAMDPGQVRLIIATPSSVEDILANLPARSAALVRLGYNLGVALKDVEVMPTKTYPIRAERTTESELREGDVFMDPSFSDAKWQVMEKWREKDARAIITVLRLVVEIPESKGSKS